MDTRFPTDGNLPPLPDETPVMPEVMQRADVNAQPGATIAGAPGTIQPGISGPLVGLPFFHLRSLRCGCYLINYAPSRSLFTTYDGTMRVECHRAGRTVSGDLYQRRLIVLPLATGFPPTLPRILVGPAPNPAAGIPILARAQYRYYIRVTQVLESWTFSNRFTLGFQLYRFSATTAPMWSFAGDHTAEMVWTTSPSGYPSPGDYLAGDVKNASGSIVGRLTMGWVSNYLRRATVELDRVSVSESPVNNGAGLTWQSIFDDIGWQVAVDHSDSNITEPSGTGWSDAEMHAAMLARRDASNLDAEWRYHVISVRTLDSTSRGIMYDVAATDSNNVPREGAGISSHWMIPNTNTWGLVKGLRFGTATAPYFRTAVHEIGHAMGLYHNTVDYGIMNTTDVIAAAGTATVPFPTNVQWSFAPDDAKKLRHYPDPYVRPGGTAFGTASTFTPPITPTDLQVSIDGLELRVTPMLEALPIGAPVRVNVQLVNISDQPQIVPESLSLKTGFTRGTVTDPAGTVRTFLPLVQCIEEHPMKVLQPGETLANSMTLLRGGQGALFPNAGPYQITIDAHWPAGEAEVVVRGATTVMVTAAVDDAHARAANAVLSTPDTLITLALGGDHMADAIDAIHIALNDPVLRPHFAYIEAKRLAEPFFDREPKWQEVDALIEDATIMSPAEITRAKQMVDAAGEAPAAKEIGKTLDQKSGRKTVAGSKAGASR